MATCLTKPQTLISKLISTKHHVAVDMDEVIVPMLKPLNKHYAKQYSTKPIDLNQVSWSQKYNYAQIFDISPREAQWLVYSYWNSDRHLFEEPLPNALNALNTMKSNGSKVTILTARQHYGKTKTIEWLDAHGFSDAYDDIIFTNSYSLVGISENKEDICRLLGVDLLIDDSFETISNCNKAGIDTLWFTGDPRYFWCYTNDPSVSSFRSISMWD